MYSFHSQFRDSKCLRISPDDAFVMRIKRTSEEKDSLSYWRDQQAYRKYRDRELWSKRFKFL